MRSYGITTDDLTPDFLNEPSEMLFLCENGDYLLSTDSGRTYEIVYLAKDINMKLLIRLYVGRFLWWWKKGIHD